LSQAAIDCAEVFGDWLAFEEDCACMVVFFEHYDWMLREPFISPDSFEYVRKVVVTYYPQYFGVSSGE